MKRFVWGMVTTIGAISLPFLAISGYLAWAGNGSQRSGSMDILVFMLAVLSGFVCLLVSPIPKSLKLAFGIVYLPVMGFMVFAYTFQFVCAYYRDCL